MKEKKVVAVKWPMGRNEGFMFGVETFGGTHFQK